VASKAFVGTTSNTAVSQKAAIADGLMARRAVTEAEHFASALNAGALDEPPTERSPLDSPG